MSKSNGVQLLPGGICFAHGPYQHGYQCPRWPACATDPKKQEYMDMSGVSQGQAQTPKPRNWRDLYDKLPPERRAKIEAEVMKDLAELKLIDRCAYESAAWRCVKEQGHEGGHSPFLEDGECQTAQVEGQAEPPSQPAIPFVQFEPHRIHGKADGKIVVALGGIEFMVSTTEEAINRSLAILRPEVEKLEELAQHKMARVSPTAAIDPEKLAQIFHETYERLAPSFNYETRRESAKPWSDVPENNKRLMTAVCADVLVWLKQGGTQS